MKKVFSQKPPSYGKERGSQTIEKLIIPTAAGTLSAFNDKPAIYNGGDSQIHLLPSDSLDPVFILGLYSFLYHRCRPYDTDTYTIRTEELRRFLGYSRGGKSRNIVADLTALEEVCGCVRGAHLPLAEVERTGHYIIVRSRYFNELSNIMKESAQGGSRYTSLVWATVAKVKSRPAVEVCIELCKLVERRGRSTTPAHISVATLLERCCSLRRSVDAAQSRSRKNQVLSYSIKKGVRLMKSESSVYDEYKELVVTIPEVLSLEKIHETIQLAHEGKQNLKKEVI